MKNIDKNEFFEKKLEKEIENKLKDSQWDVKIAKKVFDSIDNNSQKHSFLNILSKSKAFKVINTLAAAAMILFVIQIIFHPFDAENDSRLDIVKSDNTLMNKKQFQENDLESNKSHDINFDFEVDYDYLIQTTLNQR